MKAPAAVTVLFLLSSACAQAPQQAPASISPAAASVPVFGTPPPGRRPRPAPEQEQEQEQPPAGDFELRMTRGACYGICPSYSLTIHADGGVDYEGSGHVAAGGPQHGQADAQALARLRAELSDPAFNLWGDYVRGAPACGPWATDMPGVSIEAYVGGRWRHIHHNLGCHDAPAVLRRLEQDIDDAAGSSRWTGGEAVR